MKIAFFVQHMIVGGVETALLSLVKTLTSKGHKVIIYMIKEEGGFVQSIPEAVEFHAIPMEEEIRRDIPVGGIKISIRENLEERKYLHAFQMGAKFLLKRSGFAELGVDFDKIPELKENFDIAVNYHLHSPFLVKYVAEKIHSTKKYAWIHNDFKTTNYRIQDLKNYLQCIDHYFCVSKQLQDEFIDILPEYKSITSVAHNIVPIAQIREKATIGEADEFNNTDGLKLLTVGRVEEQKGYDIAIEVCEKLVKECQKFKWIAIGDGTLLQTMRDKVKQKGLSQYMIFVGSKMNPYPYFSQCDIYIQPSRHEGWGLTISEAKAFYKPIVTTDFAGAREQIVNGVSGSITAIEADDIYKHVSELMNDSEKRNGYSVYLEANYSIENEEWLDFFEEVVG